MDARTLGSMNVRAVGAQEGEGEFAGEVAGAGEGEM